MGNPYPQWEHYMSNMAIEGVGAGPADNVLLNDATKDAAKPTSTKGGYPADTSPADMTAEEQAAYWRAMSKRHENHVKSFGDLKPEQAREMQAELDRLRQASLSDTERAVETAKTEARKEAMRETAPRLVAAEFRAAAKGVLTDEQTAALIEDLDLTKYLTDNGEVDVEKVGKKVSAFAPAKKDPKFPDVGQGRREGAPGASVSTGADLYASRHGSKSGK